MALAGALRGFEGCGQLLNSGRQPVDSGAQFADFAAELLVLRTESGVLGFQFPDSRVHAAAQLARHRPALARSISWEAVNKYV